MPYPMCVLLAWSVSPRGVLLHEESLSAVALSPAWFGDPAMRPDFCLEELVNGVRRRLKQFHLSKQLSMALIEGRRKL